MKISDRGLEFTASSEGTELKAYQDTGGVWTIGVGHTSDENLEVTPGLVITKAEAMRLLAIDIQEAEDVVNRLVKVPLTQGQWDATVDFAFNIGEGQFGKSTFLKLLNAGLYEKAAEQFKRWIYDNGKIQPGLVKRAYGRKAMFLET